MASTPPLSPPRIAFDPPLFLQRRAYIHQLLKELCNGPNAKFKPEDLTSLLDVGCGLETDLLRSLVQCDDELQLTRLVGIDLDIELGRMVNDGSWDIERLTWAEDRWRELSVEFYQGSFEDLTRELGRFDVIVSSEVVEHLDPIPLATYPFRILETLRPKVFICTTPNRDFNRAFDVPLSSPPEFTEFCAYECDTEGRYWRPNVPYPMRHHDHRFEWSREEFQDWATKQADIYGYEVTFTGVGSLSNGLISRSDEMKAIIDRELEVDEVVLKDLANQLAAAGIEDSIERASRAWGECTQIAVFTIKPNTFVPRFPTEEEYRTPVFLTKLLRKTYPITMTEEYPPSQRETYKYIFSALPGFLPAPVARHWAYPPSLDIPVWERESPEDTEIYPYEDERFYTPEELEEIRRERKEERRAIKAEEQRVMRGMKAEDVCVVRGAVNMQNIWEASYPLRKAWRFNFSKFLESLKCMDGMSTPEFIVHAEGGTIYGQTCIKNCQQEESARSSSPPENAAASPEDSYEDNDESWETHSSYSAFSDHEYNAPIYDDKPAWSTYNLAENMTIHITLSPHGQKPDLASMDLPEDSTLTMPSVEPLECEKVTEVAVGVWYFRPKEFDETECGEDWREEREGGGKEGWHVDGEVPSWETRASTWDYDNGVDGW